VLANIDNDKTKDTQEIHRDTPSLFEEMEQETPMFQLAVNFPLVDVTIDPWSVARHRVIMSKNSIEQDLTLRLSTRNGPLEITKGTHMLKKEASMAKFESREAPLEAIAMKVGDVMIRDVRGLHR